MTDLFTPISIGAWELPNRLIMAPLTRCRAIHNRVPNPLMAEYYRQRARAGLIITEATSISPMAVGYPNTPGIWNQDQIAGWQLVTDAVHQEGGTIILQLWHVGRISDPSYLNGELPLAPSAIAADGHVSLIRPKKEFVTPRALDLNEIPVIIEQYRTAAKHAKMAGFDGVEIHGANGYLLDQFLQTNSNQRNDQYGGSVENRARLMLEVTDAVISVFGSERVGMHLAPRCDAHSMGDESPKETFSFIAKQLRERQIAFICTREYFDGSEITPVIKQHFGGPVIANENFNLQLANQVIADGTVDAVAFGKKIIANPDLLNRFQQQTELNEPNPHTFYGDTAEGYTDYPALTD